MTQTGYTVRKCDGGFSLKSHIFFSESRRRVMSFIRRGCGTNYAMETTASQTSMPIIAICIGKNTHQKCDFYLHGRFLSFCGPVGGRGVDAAAIPWQQLATARHWDLTFIEMEYSMLAKWDGSGKTRRPRHIKAVFTSVTNHPIGWAAK